jgi:hypothetical protein
MKGQLHAIGQVWMRVSHYRVEVISQWIDWKAVYQGDLRGSGVDRYARVGLKVSLSLDGIHGAEKKHELLP